MSENKPLNAATPTELESYNNWRKALFGRKTKFTPKTRRKILYFTRQGHKNKTICALVGISEDRLYHYLNLYPDFAEDFERAKEYSVAKHVKNIEGHAKKDWKASAFLLSKLRPEEFGDTNSVTYLKQNNTQLNITFDGTGYIPPDNVLGLKPTLKKK